MIVASVVLTQCQRVTDRRADGRIYDSYSTALSIQVMLTRCKNGVTAGPTGNSEYTVNVGTVGYYIHHIGPCPRGMSNIVHFRVLVKCGNMGCEMHKVKCGTT